MRPVLDKCSAPLPHLGGPFEHQHDLGFVPLIALLGAQVPPDALAHLRAFQGERQVERVIADAPRRVATAWIGAERMLGGEFTSRAAPASNQLHPATIHWRMPDGQIGWVRMLYRNPADARAERDRLEIATSGEVAFAVHAPGARAGDLTRNGWQLPGLSVRVETDAASMDARERAGLLEARYAAPADQPLHCRLICEDSQ
jgi:hypothetical protein